MSCLIQRRLIRSWLNGWSSGEGNYRLPVVSSHGNNNASGELRKDPAAMRRYRRKPVIWAASLEASNGVFDCIILDLSSGGAKLKLSQVVPLNQPAVLSVGRFGTFPCRIVRSEVGEAGIQFSEPPHVILGRLGEILPLDNGSQ